MVATLLVTGQIVLVLWVIGVGPARWLLPDKRLALWSYAALPLGIVTVAIASDLLGLFLPARGFASVILIAGFVAAVSSVRRRTAALPARLRFGDHLGGLFPALIALGYGVVPNLLEGTPTVAAVTVHDWFSYSTLADSLREKPYFDFSVGQFWNLPGHDVLARYAVNLKEAFWRVGLPYVDAFFSLLLQRPASETFGSTCGVTYALWPLATFLSVAWLGHKDALRWAGWCALANAPALFLVSELYGAHLVALSLSPLIAVVLADSLGTRTRRGVLFAAVLGAGWLAIFADGGIVLVFVVASATWAARRRGRKVRSIAIDLAAVTCFAAVMATPTIIRGVIAGLQTIEWRVEWGVPMPERWEMPSALDLLSQIAGSDAEASVRGGVVESMPLGLSVTLALLATAAIWIGWRRAAPATRILLVAPVVALLVLAVSLATFTGSGYLTSKSAMTASMFATIAIALAQVGERRWAARLVLFALLCGVGRSAWQRIPRHAAVTAEHRLVRDLVRELPAEGTVVLTGTGQDAHLISDELALLYLIGTDNRPLRYAGHRHSFVAWMDQFVWDISIGPSSPILSIEPRLAFTLASGETVLETESFRVRRVDESQPFGRWELRDGWHPLEDDGEERWSWFSQEATVIVETFRPHPAATFQLQIRLPEDATPRPLTIMARRLSSVAGFSSVPGSDEQSDRPIGPHRVVARATITSAWSAVTTEPLRHTGATEFTLRVPGPPFLRAGRLLSAAVRELSLSPANRVREENQ